MMENRTKLGECELCQKTVMLTLRHNNIWMCDLCWDDQRRLMNSTIEQAKHADQSIQLKQDLFNAKTIATMELKAAIDNDPTIPANEKDYRFTEVLQRRISHFTDVILTKRAELIEMENEKRAMFSVLQQSAVRLSKEERNRLHIKDRTYPVKPIKPIKPAKDGTPSKGRKPKVDVEAARKYAAQYGVPAEVVIMLAGMNNITPEEAAKRLKKSMDK